MLIGAMNHPRHNLFDEIEWMAKSRYEELPIRRPEKRRERTDEEQCVDDARCNQRANADDAKHRKAPCEAGNRVRRQPMSEAMDERRQRTKPAASREQMQ